MKVLEVGGGGYVGSLINPYLAEWHQIRVLDVYPPRSPVDEYQQGSLFDVRTVRRAMRGMDALIYLAMGKNREGSVDVVSKSYDVNVKGVHKALAAAAAQGVTRCVYASSMSVYKEWTSGDVRSEEVLPDAVHVYGFTKRLGEEVCELFTRSHGMSCVALRLCAPVSREEWLEKARPGVPTGATSAPDVARAFHLALVCERTGFDAFFITGDYEGHFNSLARARKILGWAPVERPVQRRKAA